MMKKYFNMTIILVFLTLLLSGCGENAPAIPTTTNAYQEVASTNEETSTVDSTQEITTEEASNVTETNAPITTVEQASTEPTQTESNDTTSTSTASQTTTSQTTIPQTTIPVTEAQIKNTLKITGKVTYEMSITLDELKSLDDIIVEEDYYSFNSFATKGHTRFKGVNLWFLLDQYAGIEKDASSITVIATDGYKMTFTIEQIMKQDYIDETDPDKKLPVIIAWVENGTEYDPEDGAPYKLVIGQTAAGDVNKPQWVSMIDSIIVE